MDTPVSLLKNAVYEADAFQRTTRAVKACKIITDILPWDKRNHALIDEPEMMKYLMICLPLNPVSVIFPTYPLIQKINLIINTMIDKFRKIHHFLREIWQGFDAVASLAEVAEKPQKASEGAMKLLQLGIKKLLKLKTLKELDDTTLPNQLTKSFDYCEEIVKNKEVIKLKTLEYVEKIIELYFLELREVVPFKPDITGLLKKFIQNSPNEKVIIKSCQIIEKLKLYDSKFHIDNEVEELLINKRGSLSTSSIAGLEELTSRSGLKSKIHSQSQSQSQSQNQSLIIQSTKSAGVTAVANKLLDMFKPRAATTNAQGSQNSIPEVPESNDDTKTDSSGENNENDKEEAIIALEEWLSDGDIHKLAEVPIITKNQLVTEALKSNENFENMLTFILDPTSIPIAPCWELKHPFLEGCPVLEMSGGSSPKRASTAISVLKSDRKYHPFMLRSFKTMQALVEIRNFKYIVQFNKLAVENFFHMLYVCSNRNDSLANHNHIAKVTEYFLKKEPELCMNFIIHYNVPFKLLQNIEFHYVQHCLLTLMNCSETSTDIGEDVFKKLLKYLSLTSFFLDLTNAILTGEKSIDTKKFDSSFKPAGVEEMVDIHNEYELGVVKADDKPQNYTIEPEKNASLIEESSGFKADIDGIMTTIKGKKKVDKKSILSQSVNIPFNKKNLSPKRKSIEIKYPSILAKTLAEEAENERIENLKSINASQTSISLETSKFLNTKEEEELAKELNKSSRSKTNGARNINLKVIIPNSSQQFINKNLTSGSGKVTTTNASQISEPSINIHIGPQTTTTSKQGILKFKPNSTATSIEDISRDISKDKSQFAHSKKDSLMIPTGFTQDKIVVPKKDFVIKSPNQSQAQLKDLNNVTNGSISQLRGKPSITNSPTLRASSKNEDPTLPQRRTIINEFDRDVMGKKEIKLLYQLYPYSTRNILETDIDKESKKLEYTVSNIRANDTYSIALCDFLEIMFRKTLAATENQKLRKIIGLPDINYGPFWDAFFSDGKCWAFERLIKNYLIKIKIHHLESINSGYGSGVLVNTILQKCATHPYLTKYLRLINDICRAHFQYLCKSIIHSHAWVTRTDTKVYLQTLEVKDPLGTGRILLTETLKYIIENDQPNSYSIINEINDTTWHTLILWFFDKKNNDIYQRIFFSILKTTFKYTNEKLIVNLLLKLNILSNMYKTWYEICQNNVFLKDKHIESILYHLKQIVILIETTLAENENYTTLQEQLSSCFSWIELRAKLLPKDKRRKKMSQHSKDEKKGRGGRKGTFLAHASPNNTSRTDATQKSPQKSPLKGSH